MMQSELEREALSSTQNTGWEHLASTHLNLYRLAVEKTPPDHRAAVTHLKEHWNQHQGIGMPKMQQCHAHLRFATCYHALGQIADAARSVVTLYQVADELTPADVPTGNVAGVQAWLCEQIVNMDRLHIFLRRRSILFKTPETLGLGLRDRLRMRMVMASAKGLVDSERKFRETRQKTKETLEELREFMVERGEDVTNFDEMLQNWD